MKFLQILATVVALLISTNAYSQEAGPLFEAGAKQYLAGEFEEAIVSWQKAYSMQPAAIILYNIALASGKLGNHSQAIGFANRAETEKQNPLDASYLAKNAANRQSWQMAIRSTRTAERLRREYDAVAGTKPLGWKAWAGIGAASLGVISLGGSAFFALQASDGIDKAKESTDPDEHAKLRTDTQDQQVIGQVLLYTGAGLIVVGTTLFILDRTMESGPTVSMHLTGNGVGFSGTF